MAKCAGLQAFALHPITVPIAIAPETAAGGVEMAWAGPAPAGTSAPPLSWRRPLSGSDAWRRRPCLARATRDLVVLAGSFGKLTPPVDCGGNGGGFLPLLLSHESNKVPNHGLSGFIGLAAVWRRLFFRSS